VPSHFWSRPFLYNIGTFGSAVSDLSWNDENYTAFDIGLNQYSPIDFTYDDMKLYSAGAPFTELHWRFGGEKLEHLVAEHGQVIGGRLGIGAKYQRSSSVGFYTRQRTGANNGYAYMMYQGKKRKYKARIEFIHNGYIAEQNGGTQIPISDTETIFDAFEIGQRELVPVNLQNAQSSHKTSEYGFTHFYDIGNDISVKRNDTLSYLEYIPKWRFQHRASYTDEYYLYSDDTPTLFYGELLLEPSVIRDYLRYYRWQNNVDLIYTANTVLNDSIIQSPFRFSFGLESGFHFVKQIFDNDFNAQSLDLKVRLEKNPLHAGFGPYNAGAYSVLGKAGYKLKNNNSSVYASLESRSQKSAYINTAYFSNVHQWSNVLPNYKRNTLGLHSENLLGMISADVYMHRLNNYQVWDPNFDPILVDANLFQSSIEATIPLGRKFKIRNYLALNISDRYELALPVIAARHYVYLEDKIFKGALDGQAGIDLNYNTPFKPLSYAPTIGQFYYNPFSEVERGFTPTLGAFLSFKVRTVVVMGRAEFINQGLGFLGDLESSVLGTNGYFLHPNYPASDRLFSLAVRWQFYD